MKRRFHRFFIATALAFAFTVGLQWSWNTLAPLFAGPVFQFRHALASLALLLLVAGLLRLRPLWHARAKHHEL